MMNWKDKLRAFLYGLEVQNVEVFLKHAKVSDYEALGKKMAERIKLLKKQGEI